MAFTLMLSVLEFIILAIGFTFGFWLLITACKEEGWKKRLGQVFAWILIIYAVIIAGMICFQWINYLQTGRLPVQPNCPMHQMMMQKQIQGGMGQRTPMMKEYREEQMPMQQPKAMMKQQPAEDSE